jgi:chromosome segregation ATPase
MRTKFEGGLVLVILMTGASIAGAQAPAGADARETVQQKQRQAGAAFSELQKAQHEARLAEQDFLNAQDADTAARKAADERRQQLEAARKTLSAAQAKVAQARQRYDEAVSGVDKVFKK